VTKGLTIKNTVKGQLKNLNIVQHEDFTELGAKTKLRITFSTTNPIPSSAKLLITLPSNLKIGTLPKVTINKNLASVKLDERAFILTITRLNAVKDFDIVIEEGIYNPTAGPYAYDRF